MAAVPIYDRHVGSENTGRLRRRGQRGSLCLSTRTGKSCAGPVFVQCRPAFASSSGLNNIPTADTAPNLTLVIQGYSLFGAQRSPDHFAAFKFRVDPWESRQWRNRFEWGLDSRIGSGEIGPSVLQAKWATQAGPKWPAISVGVANLAPTRSECSRAGEPFSFIVLSQDLKVFRLHGGYALQTGNNNTVMLGLDRTSTCSAGRSLCTPTLLKPITARIGRRVSVGSTPSPGSSRRNHGSLSRHTAGRPASL
jgi:hypothetical protein